MPVSKVPMRRRDFIRALGAAVLLPVGKRFADAGETTATATVSEPESEKPHRIVTANILATLSEHDGTPVDWETQRRKVCFNVLKNQRADIICLQEVLRSQHKDFQERFPEFHLFGYEGPYMDTNPKRFQGIKNVIMYSRNRYDLTSAGSYTLSETPLMEGSRSWGDQLGRHVNWVRLQDKNSGREFRVLNTHLSVRNQVARENSAKLIVAESSQYHSDFPQLLAGDFNARVTNPTIDFIKDGGWIDTWSAVHGDKDPGSTGHGFARTSIAEIQAEDVQIDWIFCRGNVNPVASRVIRDHINGHYPSDHFFVSADVRL